MLVFARALVIPSVTQAGNECIVTFALCRNRLDVTLFAQSGIKKSANRVTSWLVFAITLRSYLLERQRNTRRRRRIPFHFTGKPFPSTISSSRRQTTWDIPIALENKWFSFSFGSDHDWTGIDFTSKYLLLAVVLQHLLARDHFSSLEPVRLLFRVEAAATRMIFDMRFLSLKRFVGVCPSNFDLRFENFWHVPSLVVREWVFVNSSYR